MRFLRNTQQEFCRGATAMIDAVNSRDTTPTPAKLPSQATAAQRQAAYEAYVAAMADKSDGTLFLNHDQVHAEIVLAQLFRSARSDIKILSGCLLDEVYGSDRVSSAAKHFAVGRPGGIVHVLHEHPVGKSRFVEMLSDLMGDRFRLTEIGPSKIGHFAVADKVNFRVETDQDHHKAFVAFGDSKIGETLSTIFDNIVEDLETM